jgi:hypothetical protein
MAAGEKTARRDPLSGDHGGLSGWPLGSACSQATPSNSQWNVFSSFESPGLIVPAIRQLFVAENRWPHQPQSVQDEQPPPPDEVSSELTRKP